MGKLILAECATVGDLSSKDANISKKHASHYYRSIRVSCDVGSFLSRL